MIVSLSTKYERDDLTSGVTYEGSDWRSVQDYIEQVATPVARLLQDETMKKNYTDVTTW